MYGHTSHLLGTLPIKQLVHVRIGTKHAVLFTIFFVDVSKDGIISYKFLSKTTLKSMLAVTPATSHYVGAYFGERSNIKISLAGMCRTACA